MAGIEGEKKFRPAVERERAESGVSKTHNSFSASRAREPVSYIGWQAAKLPNFRKCSAYAPAFTMAEILISLTIIGIIAAITLPSLQANINEKTWATQRKALYSRMSQAISMMPSLNGYGVVFEDGSINETATINKTTQAFITDGLSKVLKISNICDSENLKKCGFPDKFKKMGRGATKMDTPVTITGLNGYFSYNNGGNLNYSQLNTKAAAFETVNGESVLTFYNPNCSYVLGMNNSTLSNFRGQNLMQPTMCANFVFDLNGRKGPNQVGKDIGFMTAFYPADSVLAAPFDLKPDTILSGKQFTLSLGNSQCRKRYGTDYRMANIEELKSIFTNNKLGYLTNNYQFFIQGTNHISSTLNESGQKLYWLTGYTGEIFLRNVPYTLSVNAPIFCVRR